MRSSHANIVLLTLPGAAVVHGNDTFTDQVSGFGGSAKREIGRRLRARTLRARFEKAWAAAAKHRARRHDQPKVPV
jgi:hypothetical protein